MAQLFSTDLLELDLCEASGDFDTVSEYGSGNLALGAGVDFVFQGTNAVDVKVGGTALRGMMSNKQGTITNTAGIHFYVWCQVATAGVMDLKANGGKRICIGDSTSDYMAYYVDGSDTNLEGGYKCYPIRYTTTASSLVEKFGTPAADPDFVGAMLRNTGVTVKSSNFSVDAMRYGEGLLYASAGVGDAISFADTATYSDDITRKWGILTPIEGGVSLKGDLIVGQAIGTPAECEFTDSNALVAFSDTEFSESTLSKFSVDHADTVVDLTNCNFLAIGTNNRGQLVGLNASSTVLMTVCAMNGIGLTLPEAGWSFIGCNWNGADQIIQNGCLITGGSIQNSTATEALIADDISLVTKVHFVGSGSGHAVDLGNFGADETIVWDNTIDLTTYALDAGADADKVILVDVDAGFELIISVSSTGNTPTVYNTGDGDVDVQSGNITLSVTVLDDTDGSVITDANVYLHKAGDTGTVYISKVTNGSGIASEDIPYDADTNLTGWVRRTLIDGDDFIQLNISGEYTSTGFSTTVRLVPV